MSSEDCSSCVLLRYCECGIDCSWKMDSSNLNSLAQVCSQQNLIHLCPICCNCKVREAWQYTQSFTPKLCTYQPLTLWVQSTPRNALSFSSSDDYLFLTNNVHSFLLELKEHLWICNNYVHRISMKWESKWTEDIHKIICSVSKFRLRCASVVLVF
jgi:hypothetical protein